MGAGGCWFSQGEILVVTALVASRLPRLLVVCMGDSDLSANTHQLLPERWENLKSVMSSGSKCLS